jgi:hypothetical protein
MMSETDKKFIASYSVEDWEVLTETGYEEISHIHKTVEYDVYTLRFSNGDTLKCADDHILIGPNGEEIFAKDALNRYVVARGGITKCVTCETTYDIENMYDLTVNSENHTYYTNSVLSHNTISSAIWLLHYMMFNPEKTVAVLANKGATAREILARITLALENIPFFLQPGCKVLNKGSVVFSNNSRIIAAATSSSSIRGMSCDVVMLDEFAFIQNADTFYTSTYPVISSGKNTKIIITSTPNGVGNLFHRIWEGAISGKNEFKPFKVNWWDVPGRDEKVEIGDNCQYFSETIFARI